MNQRILKWLSYLMIATLVVGIAGCNKNRSGLNNPATSNTPAETETAIETIAETTNTQPTLDYLKITPSIDSMTMGNQAQLTATAFYLDGTSESATTQVQWTSSQASILSVSNAGQLESLNLGNSIITATLNDVSSAFELRSISVVPPLPASVTLSRISITPLNQKIAKGVSLPFTAIGIYSDNTSQDITASVIWSSADTSIALVSALTQSSGIAEGLKVGTTTIVATLDGEASNTQITITEAQLVDISIDSGSTEIIKGTSTQLQATGIFSDGSKQAVTEQALWSSSQKTVATILNGNASAGKLLAVDVGSSNISVTLDNISANTNVDVIDATLTSISITPGILSLTEGSSSQLQAIGLLSNDSTLDLSSIVDWVSDAPDILSVDDNGFVTSKISGDATITASFNSVSSALTITVDSASLVSIEVSPQNSRIAIGTKLTLSATGIYSNDTHRDITQNVLWQSDAPLIIEVSNAGNKEGFVYSLSAGSATISATLSTALSSTQQNIVGTSSITVNEKTVEGITILFDGNNTLAAGNTIDLNAIANYSDGSILDISDQVTWQSTSKEICDVSTAENNFGRLNAKSTGMCNISAKFGDLDKLSSIIFTVTDATLQSIDITPNTAVLAKGTSILLVATGYYSDSTSSNISNQVNWKSNNALVSVSNENGSKGLLNAITTGDSTITANYSNITATSVITVSAATLDSITISTDVTGDFNLGTTQSYVAMGTYSDQTTQNISTQVLWASSDKSTATVSNAEGSTGEVTSLNAGGTTLSAQLSGISSNQIAITITDAPLAPISVSARATPYIILNDGSDASTIALSILAADNALNVQDGTEVQLSIINGSGSLSANTVTSVDGNASFDLTSTTKGLITVEVKIAGSEIINYVTIYATDSFADIIARYGFSNGSLVPDPADSTKTLVAANSQFSFLIINYANRAFTINGYRVFNGETIVAETADSSALNNNLLAAGGNILITYTASEALSNTYVAVYYLTDEKTGQQFAIAAGFTFQ